MTARITLAAVLAGLASPAAHAAPSAADREQARLKLNDGAKLLGAGNAAQALTRFQEAYALVPSPKIFYNLALALSGVGRQAEAYNAFNRFINEAKDASPGHLKHAREQLDKLGRSIAYLDLLCDTEGAEVYLSGRRLGVTPLPDRVAMDTGTHELVVKADGIPPDSRRFSVMAGDRMNVRVELKRPGRTNGEGGSVTPPTHSATPPGPLPTPVVGSTPAGGALEPARPSQPEKAEPSADSQTDWRRPAGWIAAAAAVGALGFGVYQTASFIDKVDEFNTRRVSRADPTLACGADLPMKGREGCQDLHNKGQTALKWALVGYGLTAALGAAAIVFFVTAPSSRDPARESASASGCGLRGLGATCRFTF